MSVVARVKRHIDEEPLKAIVLYKRCQSLKEDSDPVTVLTSKDELLALLKFAGAISRQDDMATKKFIRLIREDTENLNLHTSKDDIVKARKELHDYLHEERYRVVNCLRTTLEEDNANEKSEEIVIVDIEKNPIKGDMAEDSDIDYVYDLYMHDNEQRTDYVDLMDDNNLSVRVFDDIVSENEYDSSEDSNQEDDSGALHNDFNITLKQMITLPFEVITAILYVVLTVIVRFIYECNLEMEDSDEDDTDDEDDEDDTDDEEDEENEADEDVEDNEDDEEDEENEADEDVENDKDVEDDTDDEDSEDDEDVEDDKDDVEDEDSEDDEDVEDDKDGEEDEDNEDDEDVEMHEETPLTNKNNCNLS